MKTRESNDHLSPVIAILLTLNYVQHYNKKIEEQVYYKFLL